MQIYDMVKTLCDHKQYELLGFARVDGDSIQAPGAYILVRRQFKAADPYASWFYNAQDGGLHHGHYHSDPAIARHDYWQRVASTFDMMAGS